MKNNPNNNTEKNKKAIKEFIELNIVIILVIIVSNILHIRICLFYNIFKIPCAGCGITRGINELLHGNIQMALKYNYLSIVLIVLYLIIFIWSIIDIINKKNTLNNFIKKHKIIIIIIAVICTITAWIININNPLLY